MYHLLFGLPVFVTLLELGFYSLLSKLNIHQRLLVNWTWLDRRSPDDSEILDYNKRKDGAGITEMEDYGKSRLRRKIREAGGKKNKRRNPKLLCTLNWQHLSRGR